MIGNILDPGGSCCENEDQIANELKQVSQKIQERDNKYAIDPTKHMPELDEYSFPPPPCCQEEKRGITVRRQISTSSLWHCKHVLEHIRNGRQKVQAELLLSWVQDFYNYFY